MPRHADNQPELARGAKGLIRMEDNQTILEPPDVQLSGRSIEKKPQVFSFGELSGTAVN